MSDFPFNDSDEADRNAPLPQSGVRPNTMDESDDFSGETLPQSGVRPSSPEDDDEYSDETLLQSAVDPDGDRTEPDHYIGKYPILRQLGEGGMGVVWLGHHPELDIKVAVKTLPTHLISRDPSFVERFIKEARTAARINHPNVVRIYDAGHDDDLHYIVMEFVEGGNVHDLIIDTDGPLPVERALEIIIQCAEGLKAAAEYKIIHRDIKPENIMLDSKGVPKLADLGLAKQLDAEEMSMTGTGMAVGTPSYMAPEQVQNAKNCDARADIYSLGATFYHLVTGKVPFTASSAFDMMLKHVQEPLPPPTDRNPKVPKNIEAVICMMLEKSPELRYQSAEELLEDLYQIKYSDAPIKKLRAGQQKQPSTSIIQGVAIGKAAPQEAKRSKRVPVLIAVATVLMGAGIFGAMKLMKQTPTPVPPTDPDTALVMTESSDPMPPATTNNTDTPVVSIPDQTVDITPVKEPIKEPAEPLITKIEPKVSVDIPLPVVPPPVVTPVDVTPPPATRPIIPKSSSPTLGAPIPLALAQKNPTSHTLTKLDLELVAIPAGTFTMGSNASSGATHPAHPVKLSRPFWIGNTEVSNKQFAQFAKAKNYRTTAENAGYSMVMSRGKAVKKNRINWTNASKGDSMPVTCISYEDAQNFCNWLNESEKLPLGYKFRLPTEAEWEYSCRANWKGSFGFDSVAEHLETYCSYADNTRSRLQPIKSRKANRWKLYDMHGNAMEWCLDSIFPYQKTAVIDPLVGGSSTYAVRGGSFASASGHCDAMTRLPYAADYSGNFIGFRIVLAPVIK